MKYPKKIIVLVYALGLIIPSTLLQAGDHSHHGLHQQSNNSGGGGGNSSMTDSQSSVLLTALVSAVILIMPVALSVQAVEESIEQSGKAKTNKMQGCDKPCCGHQLPEMEVQRIDYNGQGQRRVLFAATDNPQQLLVLLWLDKTLQDPAAGFTVGQIVYFQPSAQFSGCLIHDAADTALAFVPAGNNVAQINYSETF